HRRAPGHRGVGGGVGQPDAVGTVVRVGRYAADGVARIDVAQVEILAGLLEVVDDPAPQEQPEVVEPGVAGRVEHAGRVFQEPLAGSFGDDDNGVRASAYPVQQVRQEAHVAFE